MLPKTDAARWSESCNLACAPQKGGRGGPPAAAKEGT
jgi:hypothetical protein